MQVTILIVFFVVTDYFIMHPRLHNLPTAVNLFLTISISTRDQLS